LEDIYSRTNEVLTNGGFYKPQRIPNINEFKMNKDCKEVIQMGLKKNLLKELMNFIR
jgi:hypothetical protein